MFWALVFVRASIGIVGASFSWMMLSYSWYRLLPLSLQTSCSNLLLLPASLIPRVGWVPFHGIFSSCQATGFFVTALYILRRQPVGHSLGYQQGKAHPKHIVAHSRLELIELTCWVRHDYPKQLLPQFPLTTLPVKPIFSQKNDLNVHLLVAH